MIKKFREYLNESEGTLTQEQKNWLNINTDGTWRVNPSTEALDLWMLMGIFIAQDRDSRI
jgi:hypothetical protein